MLVQPTAFHGVYTVEPQLIRDARGHFARTFCEKEFEQAGMGLTRMVQSNISHNEKKGTLRGLHYQVEPSAEGKLVRCTRGAIFDVVVDIRAESPTFCQWLGFELTDRNYKAVYIAPGFAHGFQTLVDDTEVFYQMTTFYDQMCARGVRWDDPAFGISWPIRRPILSDMDASRPDLKIANFLD